MLRRFLVRYGFDHHTITHGISIDHRVVGVGNRLIDHLRKLGVGFVQIVVDGFITFIAHTNHPLRLETQQRIIRVDVVFRILKNQGLLQFITLEVDRIKTLEAGLVVLRDVEERTVLTQSDKSRRLHDVRNIHELAPLTFEIGIIPIVHSVDCGFPGLRILPP
ncbi:MAG: hypothetical protein BWY82_02211 [Verrucomicrobia bacterium ADurb.Bin474]|nr:MAG: hypothetical protein BWY82_02211 [Verrucomicrobia bacterium ADurb.Bin474]